MERKDMLEVSRREKVLRIVEEGSNSEYWNILKSEIEKYIKEYDNLIERLDNKELTEKDLRERNERVFQRKFMRWFLNINEKIIKDQKSWFDKFRSTMEFMYERVTHFVK